MSRTTHPHSRGPTLAVLLSRQRPEESEGELASSRTELALLLRGLGVEVLHSVTQKHRPASTAFIGAGKTEELSEVIAALKAEHGEEAILLAVDASLRPGQQRQLENAFEVEVLDRTAVVLRVFTRRANTPAAWLQVEIARLTYEAPRIRDDGSLGDREGGGGRGGRGHTNVELAKQRVRDRIAQLRRQLDKMVAAEEQQRGRRGGLRVALVGYTNAGKSSLMRALTGSEVLVEDQLFATLGTTVRSLAPPASPPILVSDTVGFLRRLPHELVASFHSTLAEARDATLLLHVVDASDPAFREQMEVTRRSLQTVGAGGIPELVVLNKVDRLGEDERRALALELPAAVQCSALDPASVALLREAIVAEATVDLVGAFVQVPWARGELVGEIRKRAQVLTEVYGPEGTVLTVRADPADLDAWGALVLSREPAGEAPGPGEGLPLQAGA